MFNDITLASMITDSLTLLTELGPVFSIAVAVFGAGVLLGLARKVGIFRR